MNQITEKPNTEAESIRRIAELEVEKHRRLKEINADMVETANVVLELGLLWQGIGGHQHLRLSCFERIKPQLLQELERMGAEHQVTFDHAQIAVKVANATPSKFQSLQEAANALQLAFQSDGFLQVEERNEPQQSRALPPSTFVFNALSSFRQKFEKNFLSDVSSWSDDSARIVRRELEKHEKWISETKTKLPKVVDV